jgi:hypothetical protein
MKTRTKIPIIFVIALVGFVAWSMFDLVCRPCIIPPDAPPNLACPDSCDLEPRWYSWLR